MKLLLSYILIALVFAQSPDDPRQALIEAYSNKKSLLEELEKIDQQSFHIHQELSGLETSKKETLSKKSDAQIKLRNIALQYQERESKLIASTQMLYKLHRRGLARIIFGAEDPVALRRRSTYLRYLITTDKKKLKDFKTIAVTQKSLLKDLERSEKQLQTLTHTLTQKERSLKMQKDEKRTMLEVIQSERSLANKMLQEVQQSQSSFNQQFSNNTVQPTSNGSQKFSDQYGKLPWPVRGTLLHRFGRQTDPITKKTVTSRGIDIQAAEGTPVKAVASGVIRFAKFYNDFGYMVIVSHSKSHLTVYSHLSSISVRQGDNISAGTIVGTVGSTGITDTQNTPWLGFELRYKNTEQDPLNWLQK